MNRNGQRPGETARRGRGGGHPPRRRGPRVEHQQQQRRPVIPDLEPRTGPPRPAFLQTGNTPERNDPLWTTGVAGAEMMPVHEAQYVYSSFEALPHVTSCVKGNALFLSHDEERFVEQVSALQLHPPLLLAHYLSGVGNTRVPSGRDIRFRLPNRPPLVRTQNTPGWFGRVSPDTQGWYSSYPCLAVYASKVLADLDPGEYARHWDFPQEIVPEALGGGRPLSFSSGSELDAASGMKTSPLPTLLLGSQAQLGRVFFEDELTAVANKAAVFKCAYKLPAEISFAATTFCYRVVHDTDQLNEMLVDPPWVVWRFRAGQRENTIYEYAIRANQWRDHEPSFLNLSAFTTTSYLLKARLQAFNRALSG
ncbi:hypothetical protein J1N35_042754 [Gossypium stocksii]|uniref:Uncharacterized protein n=1 Tax=Gossypium stocksii TaxID=47602 RepID=A0A9D3U625_9ROSI|nr:hypothetical protein J1N35_042754 [Gossypium stocksii]